MELPTITCLRCGHVWILRTQNPKVCPKCRSPYFNTERTRPKRLITEAEYDEMLEKEKEEKP